MRKPESVTKVAGVAGEGRGGGGGGGIGSALAGLEKSGLGLIGNIMKGLGVGATTGVGGKGGGGGLKEGGKAAYTAGVEAAKTYYNGVKDAREYAAVRSLIFFPTFFFSSCSAAVRRSVFSGPPPPIAIMGWILFCKFKKNE